MPYLRVRTALVLGGVFAFAIFVNKYAQNDLSISARVLAARTHMVSLYVDGERHTVASDANTVNDLLKDFNVNLSDGDLVEPSANTQIDQPTYNVNIYRATPVVIDDNGTKRTIATGYQSPRQILAAAGISIYPEDNVRLDAIKDFASEHTIGRKIIIERALPVQIVLAGKTYNFRTHTTRVRDLLNEHGIAITGDDLLSTNLDERVRSGLRIVINHLSQDTVVVNESIEPDTKIIYDDTLLAGVEKVQTPGQAGIRQLTYLVNYINKQETGRHLLDSSVTKRTTDRVVIRGRMIVAGSRAEIVVLAQKLASDHGWTNSQWSSLYQLWMHESGFNPSARNSSSGACGIPQAYPCSKMPGFPGDAYAQINWGLNYISARYGSPSAAWAYWLSHGRTY